MPDQNENRPQSFATYFDRDAVLRLTRLLRIVSWIIGGAYAFQFIVTITVFILQAMRGLLYFGGPTDFFQQLLWQFQPTWAGLIFFVVLQAIANSLLILMDIEDNTRRAARGK